MALAVLSSLIQGETRARHDICVLYFRIPFFRFRIPREFADEGPSLQDSVFWGEPYSSALGSTKGRQGMSTGACPQQINTRYTPVPAWFMVCSPNFYFGKSQIFVPRSLAILGSYGKGISERHGCQDQLFPSSFPKDPFFWSLS